MKPTPKPSRKERQAYAKLIAAAPDLLAALRDALKVIDTHIPNEQPLCVPGISLKIRQAIDKATK